MSNLPKKERLCSPRKTDLFLEPSSLFILTLPHLFNVQQQEFLVSKIFHAFVGGAFVVEQWPLFYGIGLLKDNFYPYLKRKNLRQVCNLPSQIFRSWIFKIAVFYKSF